MERTLEKEVVVDAPVADVWQAWTTVSGVKTFFAPEARVELEPGGAYEMYFLLDAPAGSRGSEGCTITEFEPEQKLVCTWNFPTTLPSIRNEHTLVTVTMEPAGPGRTRVAVSQTGWKEGPDWDQGFRYFQRAWMLVLARLEHRFAKGPVDWSNPYTPEGF
jgi:uncharacterized protein YndB with AHSA1/START domain